MIRFEQGTWSALILSMKLCKSHLNCGILPQVLGVEVSGTELRISFSNAIKLEHHSRLYSRSLGYSMYCTLCLSQQGLQQPTAAAATIMSQTHSQGGYVSMHDTCFAVMTKGLKATWL